jgi:hypothetical protein
MRAIEKSSGLLLCWIRKGSAPLGSQRGGFNCSDICLVSCLGNTCKLSMENQRNCCYAEFHLHFPYNQLLY